MADEQRPSDQALVWFNLIDKGASVLIVGFKSAVAVAGFYFLSESVRYLAGQSTAILVEYLTDTGSGITVSLSLAFGVLGAGYGYRQHKLRRRTIMHFAPYQTAYETARDPGRTGSRLAPDGATNPDDR